MLPEKLSRPWLTLGVRLSVFPAVAREATVDLWHEVIGGLPENDQTQPRQHQRAQTGPWEGGVLQVTQGTGVPPRVVWAAAPPPTEEGLPDLDNWPVHSVLPKFLTITRAWLGSIAYDVNRIGFGLQSVLLAKDRVEAYELLQPLLPNLRIEPKTTTDLLYQVNHPVPSHILDNARLNRLMKWSALFFGTASFQATPTELAPTGPVRGLYYASLDNDLNTPAEYPGPLDTRKLHPIFDELVTLAWENLEIGEK
jgi:hypothetical protein